MMNIGETAKLAKMTSKTLRFYDEIGLVTAGRYENGYRDYDNKALLQLKFIGTVRSLGFSLEDCHLLMSLYNDPQRTRFDVKRIVTSKILEIESKMQELRSLHQTLTQLADSCTGDSRPDCPIIEKLAKKT